MSVDNNTLFVTTVQVHVMSTQQVQQNHESLSLGAGQTVEFHYTIM